jgi:hypothetical protein
MAKLLLLPLPLLHVERRPGRASVKAQAYGRWLATS